MDIETEAKEWLQRLIAAEKGKDRLRAASELSRLGVWSRGSVRTRGSLHAAGENRLPEPEKLEKVLQYLGDRRKDVRCQVALALGEWGGESAASALGRMLDSDTSEEVRLYCITALRTIGGTIAAEALRRAAAAGSEAVRDAAIGAIEELATGGRVDDTESLSTRQATPPSTGRTEGTESTPPGGPVRVRGAVRTRGGVRTSGARSRKTSPSVLAEITNTLERIRTEKTASEYLRCRAGEMLTYLKW